MIPVTVIAGGTAAGREQAIEAHLPHGKRCVAILEGIPSGKEDVLHTSCSTLQRVHVAAGCLCCTGNLVLRVTLNRVLRTRPDCIYIGLADAEHVVQLRSWLSDTPYDQLLELGPELKA